MQTPPALKKGDLIAIVCTARKIDFKQLLPALRILDSWQLKIMIGKSVFLEENQFAGSDIERTADLQYMLDHPMIKAILIARGGYGTVRIIDRLDFTKFIKRPKWIVGYSDITVLHSHINRHCKIETLHATMPINFKQNNRAALTSLKEALFGKQLKYAFHCPVENIPGQAHGMLTGGNLSVLYSLSGTASDINPAGKILFIEDVDEYLYHIDRMMMQLKRSGKLSKLKGLLVGSFTNMKDNANPFGKDAYEIIREHVKDCGFPVAFGIPAGHIPDNHSLIMGRKTKIAVGPRHCVIEC